MSAAIIPYGAIAGFSLASAMREIAAHYGIRARQLKHADGRSPALIAAARDALAWKLIHQHNLSVQRAADLLGVTPKTARDAAARHQERIAEFAAQIKARA